MSSLWSCQEPGSCRGQDEPVQTALTPHLSGVRAGKEATCFVFLHFIWHLGFDLHHLILTAVYGVYYTKFVLHISKLLNKCLPFYGTSFTALSCEHDLHTINLRKYFREKGC